MKELDESLRFADRKEWRAWLRKNHGKSKEQWVLFYKKHTGKPGLEYEAAVEEALCYGWIDGTLKRVDGEKHVIRFTPRRKRSVWAVSNKRRVRKLMKAGKMTKSGLALLEGVDISDEAIEAEEREHRNPTLPVWMEKEIKTNEKAWKNYQALPPSHRKQYLWWLTSAKREDTQKRRLEQAMGMLEEGKRVET